MNFFSILNILCSLGFIVCILGLILYKCEVLEVNSWEETIKVMFKKIIHFLYEGYTGVDIARKQIIDSLILTSEEVMHLVNSFAEHPYDTPALANYNIINGIAWIDIHAVKLVSSYKDIEFKDLSLMAYHKIQNFYMTTRGNGINLYIKVATPTRLYFAIALSEEGRIFLDRQQKDSQKAETLPQSDIPLTEEIDIDKDFGSDITL